MGATVNYSTVGYNDQQQFDYFFATALINMIETEMEK